MHPHSFAASQLSILIFKNTSQMTRAKNCRRTERDVWEVFTCFSFLLDPSCSPFQSTYLSFSSTELATGEGPWERPPPSGREMMGNACHLALVSCGRPGGKSPVGGVNFQPGTWRGWKRTFWLDNWRHNVEFRAWTLFIKIRRSFSHSPCATTRSPEAIGFRRS